MWGKQIDVSCSKRRDQNAPVVPHSEPARCGNASKTLQRRLIIKSSDIHSFFSFVCHKQAVVDMVMMYPPRRKRERSPSEFCTRSIDMSDDVLAIAGDKKCVVLLVDNLAKVS
jgi:hypothetical protein